MSDELHSIIEDAKKLVQKAANPRTGMVRVSPEVAELMNAITGTLAPESKTESAPANTPAAQKTETVVESAPSIEVKTLSDLETMVAACTKCELCKTRTQTVFSDGNGSSGLVFVGEAPGENEDLQGVPFVGRGGELLTDIIVKGMKLKREDVYICNVLKCRPPGNRDPLPAEKDECEPYLKRQLELIQPKVICALGGHAAKTLLKTDESTGRLRGRWHSYHGIPLRVTYHPAYLLRSPGEKRKTWEDIQEVMKVLSGEIQPGV